MSQSAARYSPPANKLMGFEVVTGRNVGSEALGNGEFLEEYSRTIAGVYPPAVNMLAWIFRPIGSQQVQVHLARCIRLQWDVDKSPDFCRFSVGQTLFPTGRNNLRYHAFFDFPYFLPDLQACRQPPISQISTRKDIKGCDLTFCTIKTRAITAEVAAIRAVIAAAATILLSGAIPSDFA